MGYCSLRMGYRFLHVGYPSLRVGNRFLRTGSHSLRMGNPFLRMGRRSLHAFLPVNRAVKSTKTLWGVHYTFPSMPQRFASAAASDAGIVAMIRGVVSEAR